MSKCILEGAKIHLDISETSHFNILQHVFFFYNLIESPEYKT